MPRAGAKKMKGWMEANAYGKERITLALLEALKEAVEVEGMRDDFMPDWMRKAYAALKSPHHPNDARP